MAPLTYLCTLPLPDSWFAELASRLPHVDIHRVEAGAPVDPELLARVDLLHTSAWFPTASLVPALRCVQLDTSGVDHVRVTDLWGTGIPIATLGGIAPVPMAEYAMMSILQLAHRGPLIAQYVEQRQWPSNAERLERLTPYPLPGSTVTIVGYGRIGREISRLATAFGMHVIGVSRSGAPAASDHKFDTGRLAHGEDRAEIVGRDGLTDALRRADFVVVVVPLTAETAGLLGPAELDLLKPGAFLVNIARGGIVDEFAALKRLRDGRIGGIAVDVFDEEPLPAPSVWWGEPGVLMTPHVAGLAPQYHAQTLDLVVENLRRLEDGRPLLNEVDRDAGY